MFHRDKKPKPETPNVDKDAAFKTEVRLVITKLKGIAETEESENAKNRRFLSTIQRNGSDESDLRMKLYEKGDAINSGSKARNKATNDIMIADYARKEKPTPSQKKKIEEIRKKAKEMGI